MEKNLKEAYLNMHLLNRDDRIKLMRELELQRPEFLNKVVPKWRLYAPCEVNVLLVCDGGLDFSTDGFGLSEFITSFRKLEQNSMVHIKYKVTLAHRRNVSDFAMQNPSSNPVIVNRIKNFNFDTSVTLNNFDQVWLFGIESGGGITTNEINKIDSYMNGGGGLFCTGDHGSLGKTMCGAIPRVKDMRIWDNTNASNDINEVSMNGARRNDTNRPSVGQSVAISFNNQSDNIPQNIAVRTFGSGLPHPLLSISTSKRASGIIDIMPDHPHEGECTQEKIFTVTNPITGATQTISSQIIATSFVLGGNVSGGKAATVPHCFPSISVFDGRLANIGRIAIDSTWHHFVNVNLVASGAGVGLSNADFDAVQQYYMNIATWISRKKNMLCRYKWIITHLWKKSQLIEASLNFPQEKLSKIKLEDLNSIGALAREILSDNFSPAFAEEFILSASEDALPTLTAFLNPWKPKTNDKNEVKNDTVERWINYDIIIQTAFGAGIIALRDAFGNEEELSEKDFLRVEKVFSEGTNFGAEIALKSLSLHFAVASKNLFLRK